MNWKKELSHSNGFLFNTNLFSISILLKCWITAELNDSSLFLSLRPISVKLRRELMVSYSKIRIKKKHLAVVNCHRCVCVCALPPNGKVDWSYHWCLYAIFDKYQMTCNHVITRYTQSCSMFNFQSNLDRIWIDS